MSYESVSPLLGWDGLRMEVVTDANVSEKVMPAKKKLTFLGVSVIIVLAKAFPYETKRHLPLRRLDNPK